VENSDETPDAPSPTESSDAKAPPTDAPPSDAKLEEQVAQAAPDLQRLLQGLDDVMLGKPDLTRLTVTGMLAGGHLLLEGLPGLGKTELVKGLARLCDVQHQRIQFTPDLLPGDITGNFILEEQDKKREFVFQQGPVFTNILLADEINRASPKTQSALLESMQEATVTVLGRRFELPRPFFVLATQNPIDLEGTYQLPEAQLDRFLMKLHLDRPTPDVLRTIIKEREKGRPPEADPVLSADRLSELMALTNKIYLSGPVADFISRIVEATHPDSDLAPDLIKRFGKFGGSPRAAIALANAGRTRALINGRINVGFDDIRAIVHPICNHRVLLDYAAKIEGITITQVLDEVLASVHELDRGLPAGVSV
jgi:MoxR-like ATPase